MSLAPFSSLRTWFAWPARQKPLTKVNSPIPHLPTRKVRETLPPCRRELVLVAKIHNCPWFETQLAMNTISGRLAHSAFWVNSASWLIKTQVLFRQLTLKGSISSSKMILFKPSRQMKTMREEATRTQPMRLIVLDLIKPHLDQLHPPSPETSHDYLPPTWKRF